MATMVYSDKVLEYYRDPRNVGAFDRTDDRVGTGLVGAPTEGEVIKLQIKVGGSGIIEDACFKTYGCGSAIAASSLATEWLIGRTVEQALEIRDTHISDELELPPVKLHCAILVEDAIRAAVANYKEKHQE